MSEYKKPLPEVQPWSEDFWKATKQHKLLIQECNECKTKIFYPRKFCPECWSSDLSWSEASGKGKIFTFSVTLAGVEKKFADDIPYVLALVDLEEGIRMMTNIVECKPEDVKIGMDVEVVFDDINQDFALPKWRPVNN
ncbi:transcriptional regulator [Desulfosarcina ovata subsp. sediminis]|uniref:Transcriptional regulator n=1 Tax=Desulfosarcina ovata subsp. sediminis TaxID=885957 RepID=A0A5K7ZPV4_9BACT|nr:Zn-ribbon domain-containing OB-fold protein [Desulfosarcina ovata]BBO81170.1 transcriptional regulator [Desulfosarcina ovata subsp. sediminis]